MKLVTKLAIILLLSLISDSLVKGDHGVKISKTGMAYYIPDEKLVAEFTKKEDEIESAVSSSKTQARKGDDLKLVHAVSTEDQEDLDSLSTIKSANRVAGDKDKYKTGKKGKSSENGIFPIVRIEIFLQKQDDIKYTAQISYGPHKIEDEFNQSQLDELFITLCTSKKIQFSANGITFNGEGSDSETCLKKSKRYIEKSYEYSLVIEELTKRFNTQKEGKLSPVVKELLMNFVKYSLMIEDKDPTTVDGIGEAVKRLVELIEGDLDSFMKEGFNIELKQIEYDVKLLNREKLTQAYTGFIKDSNQMKKSRKLKRHV
jgi:hypothetical protein